ncbi:hypothetical protein IGI37_002961 [Enterococcus sp. AZ194]|uniref:DEAD/DEAH box helicase family protein n=1 Tax=Enterococcus sp. AZ194 TaxID=2774629 RepID=UPI003F20AEB1
MNTIDLYPHQKKILDYVKTNPQQKTYHFVAPPGSGKTIVGLSLIDYFKKKTLILVPSLLLKEQWASQAQLYIKESVSVDILSPKELTIATYQGVYQQLQENSELLQEFEWIILDEAHHLKKVWGDRLGQAREKASHLVSISLTATPPLSSNQEEWTTYMTLNGLIDDEITTPELINQQLLNPYQDFIHFVQAEPKIQEEHTAFVNQQNDIVDQMLADEEVVQTLMSHPFMVSPLTQTHEIYDQFEVYVAMLLFLDNNQVDFSSEHWQVLGFKKQQPLPLLSKTQLSILYEWLWREFPELAIFHRLKKEHWLKEEKLLLFPIFPKEKLVGSHVAKMEAINQIVIKEEANLAQALSCVILFDRIYEEAFDFKENPAYYGAVPQFLQLHELVAAETEIALICGRFLVVSRKVAHTYFEEEAFQEIAGIHGFLRINLSEKNRKQLIAQMTNLLELGELQLVIGTVALLGEGWNCRQVNTVILGNNSSSYVQVQQLRGRVLRVKDKKPVSTIWHIGQYLPDLTWEEQPELASVIKRLSYIEGISNQQVPESVTTGILRLNFPDEVTRVKLENYNQQNFFFAKNRELLADFWRKGLAIGTQMTMPIFIRPKGIEKPTGFMQPKETVLHYQKLGLWQALSKGQLGTYFERVKARRTWKTTCQLREKLAEATLRVSQKRGDIGHQAKVVVQMSPSEFTVQLLNATYQEERCYNQLFMDIIRPVLDARYLLKINDHYFCVPKELARTKQSATTFLKEIQKGSPKCELIYTKNTIGRQKLLQAHIKSLKEQGIDVSMERLWQ